MLQKTKPQNKPFLLEKQQGDNAIWQTVNTLMRVLQFQSVGTLCKHPLSSRVQYRNHNFIKTTRFTSVGVGTTSSTKQQKATWTRHLEMWHTHEIVFQLYFVTLSTLFFNPSQYVSSRQVEQSPRAVSSAFTWKRLSWKQSPDTSPYTCDNWKIKLEPHYLDDFLTVFTSCTTYRKATSYICV